MVHGCRKGYETHLLEEEKMMVTLAGAMSTAELGISPAEMIRQGIKYKSFSAQAPTLGRCDELGA